MFRGMKTGGAVGFEEKEASVAGYKGCRRFVAGVLARLTDEVPML